MSGRGKFNVPEYSDSESFSGSEESQESLDLVEPPFADLTQNDTVYSDNEASEIDDYEREEIDYEGRDSFQSFEPKTPLHKNPLSALGYDVSYTDNIRFFQQQFGLLQQTTPLKPKPAHVFRHEDSEPSNSSFDEDAATDSDDDLFRETQMRAESTAQDEESLVKPKEILLAPLEGSIFENKEIVLEGFPRNYQFHKSFRAGWGPNGTLIVPRKAFSIQEKIENAKTQSKVQEKQNLKEKPNSCVTVSQIQIFDNNHKTLQFQALNESKKNFEFTNEIFLLENHLRFSKRELQLNDVSYFRVANPDDLIKINRKGPPHLKNYQNEAEIWYLVDMLWGKPDEKILNELTSVDKGQSDHIIQLYRRSSLSRWLKDITSPIVDDEIHNIQQLKSLDDKQNATIFHYLSTSKTLEAVDCAIKNKDFRFATLVGQANSLNTPFKISIQKQIQHWKNSNTFSALNTYRQHIYHILSGEIEDGAKILDWKRGFGLYFWYGRDSSEAPTKCNFADQLQLALTLYDDSFKKLNARYPYPSYLLKLIKEQKSEYFDTCYHLIRLFCYPTNHPLRSVLEPRNYNQFPLNYHLSWHLYRILRVLIKDSMDVHGYEQFKLLDYQISMNYAHQLELMGHWEWAIYVVLNIYYSNEIENQQLMSILPEMENQYFENKIGSVTPQFIEITVQEIISRYIPDMRQKSEKRKFLIEKLFIPESWIMSSEAIFEHYNGNYDRELQLLLQSQQWESAHTLLMKIISELILYNKADVACNSLQILFEKRKSLQRWPSRGGLFYDYFQLITSISQNSKTINEKLFQMSTTVLSKIQQWNSNNSLNSEHKLIQQGCVDKITTQIHGYLTRFGSQANDYNFLDQEMKALPSEYLKQHLDLLTNRFLKRISTTNK